MFLHVSSIVSYKQQRMSRRVVFEERSEQRVTMPRNTFFSVEEDAVKEDSVAKRQRGNKRWPERKCDSGEIVAEWRRLNQRTG